MASQVTLKALGLNYSPNNLALPEGSLVVADDVIIRRDNVIESRRGFREYSEEFGASGDRSKQLITYKNRILNHYSNILAYETGELDNNGKALFNNFSGNYSEVRPGLRIKSIESNKNLYFTTDKGIKKLAARNASDFTTSAGLIKDAGAVKALDFSADLNIVQGQTSGFLPVDSAVAYRILWGYRDLNDNLILGAPSDSISVYNYLSNIVSLDLNTFLIALDNSVQNTSSYYSVLHNTNTYGSETFGATESFSSKFKVNITDDPTVYAANLNSAAEYIDKFAILGDNTATYTFTVTALTTQTDAGAVYTDALSGNTFTVTTTAIIGATSLICTGTGDPASGISGTTNLTYVSGTGQTPTIAYSSYAKVLPFNKPLQINTAKTYTFVVSALGSSVTSGTIYRESTSGAVFVANIAANAATTFTAVGSNNPATVTGISTSQTLTRISGSGGPATITYTSFTVAQAGFSSTSGIGSIDFTSDPSTVFSAGDLIEIKNAVDGNNNDYSFTLNKKYTFTLTTAASIPTFSTFTSNGQTFTVIPRSSPVSHTLIYTGGTPVANDIYKYTEPSTGYTYDYTFDTGATATTGTAQSTAFPAITAGSTITLTRTSGTGPASLSCSLIRLTTTNTTLPCTGTGAPTSPGAATSGTLLFDQKTFPISAVSSPANPTTITTSTTAHGLYAGETVILTGTNTSASTVGTFTARPTSATAFQLYNATTPFASINVTTVTDGTGDGENQTQFPFTGYVQSDPVISTGSVYTNNSQRFTTSSYTNLTTLAAVGTGAPNATTSTTILSLYSGNGDKVQQYSAFTRGTTSYTSFNNTTTGTNTTSKYWTITSVDSVNNKILFNLNNTASITSGSAGAAVTLLSYNYRNITETGDALYTTPLSDLVVSTPATSEQLRTIQNTITRLSARLKNEKTGYISSLLRAAYADNFNTTSYANVALDITVPTTIDSSDYFLQVYRTRNFTATGVNVLGVDVTPDDEMRLVYEAFPVTSSNIIGVSVANPTVITTSQPHGLVTGNIVNIVGTNTSASTVGSFSVTVAVPGSNTFTIPVNVTSVTTQTGIVTSPPDYSFIDEYPESLRDNNANLYTNPVTGEGISQANDVPPVAQDINRFKNTLFYANTRTRQRLNPFQLLGTSDISNGDTITISNGTATNIYEFTLGAQEVTNIAFNPATVPSNLIGVGPSFTGKYFNLYSAGDVTAYYVWYRVDNVGADPAISGKTGIRVDLLSTDTAQIIRDKTVNDINAFSLDFIASVGTTNFDLDITNTDYGITTNSTDGNITGSYITIVVTTQGNGENATSTPPKVLLSQVTSSITASQAIDETARSLVRIINKQSTSPVNAYYISSSTSLPGQINFESKSITDVPFYIQFSDASGNSFNPYITPYNIDNNTITRISASVVQFTTTNAHNLSNEDNIFISLATVSGSQYLNGIYSVTVTSSTSFRINVNTSLFTTASYPFAWSLLSDVSASNNETKPNRVYYSKLNQPESVPLLNYFDIGSSDKEILRIFPLRDSLFVFKEDGLYRISGEVAPFVVGLFDSSCVLIAADTVSVANNILYCWTNKGISNVTEAGVTEVSRPIDTAILKLASSAYTNFSTASWGLGYDSDNSYTVYTCAEIEDTLATVAFRFSNLTNTWTNIKRSQTCGVINPVNDRIYTGSGINNVIDQERKNFNRTDYADKDFYLDLANQFLTGNQIQISSASEIQVGDVLTQDQGLTVYKFNTFLNKLDLDSTVGQYGYNVSTLGVTTITVNTTIYGTSTPLNHNLSNGDWINVDSSNTVPSIDGEYQISNITANSFQIQIPEALITGTSGTANKITRNYYKTLEAVSGDNLRTKVVELAAYLDTDPSLVPLAGVTYSDIVANKTGSIASVSVGNPGIINTGTVAPPSLILHEILDGRIVSITGTTTSIPDVTGTYQVNVTGTFPANFTTSTSFEIPVNITTQDASPSLTYSTTGNSLDVEDIRACFNGIIKLLNQPASGTSFKNYKTVDDTTPFEAVVTSVNKVLDIITLNLPIQLVVGEVSIYKSIPCNVMYAPITFGDPLQLKQVYEATLMFSNKAFNKVTAGFSSDLKPEFSYIEFEGQGNGNFGNYANPGFGYGFFGGSSNAAPCRTIIPRQAQRCRFINMQFSHATARELWSLYGITLTLNQLPSTRAYR